MSVPSSPNWSGAARPARSAMSASARAETSGRIDGSAASRRARTRSCPSSVSRALQRWRIHAASGVKGTRIFVSSPTPLHCGRRRASRASIAGRCCARNLPALPGSSGRGPCVRWTKRPPHSRRSGRKPW